MPSAAFWRAWSIWAVCVAVAATAVGYTAVYPLPAKHDCLPVAATSSRIP
jgi:hypothetical protein